MIILGLYGYSDVGKTTFVQNITNKKTKKYKLEQKKGLTLKVGYLNYDAEIGDVKKNIYILDHPGHLAMSTETLRNIDLLNFALYIVNSEVVDDQRLKLIKEHYFTYKELFLTFGIPYIVVFNKIDLCSPDQLKRLYMIFKTITPNCKIVPCCSLQKQSLEYSKNLINREIHKMEKKSREPEFGYRVVKSFDINRNVYESTDLKEKGLKLKGGVLGVYSYQKKQFNSDQDREHYYISNRQTRKWEYINFLKVKDHLNQNVSCVDKDKIYTIETDSDAFFYKNDSKKGCLVVSQRDLQKVPHFQKFSLSINKIYRPLEKSEDFVFIYKGQYFEAVCKKVSKKRLSFYLKKGENPFYYPCATAIVLNKDKTKLIAIGVIELKDQQ